jgi:hypothetical protein
MTTDPTVITQLAAVISDFLVLRTALAGRSLDTSAISIGLPDRKFLQTPGYKADSTSVFDIERSRTQRLAISLCGLS